MYPSFRRQPESIFVPSFRQCTRHSGESRNPFSYHHSGNVPVIPAPAGIHFRTIIPAVYPSFRRKPESIFVPSFRRCTRHSGESRNLAPPPYSTFRRSNGQPTKPPEKSAIFSDTTHLPSIQKSCTLAPASPATRPQGSDVPPKANPRRPSTRRPQPTGRRLKSKGKGIGRNNRATTKKPGSGQHGQNRRYCNHRRIRHALRSIPRGCVRPRRGRSHRSMPVQQWAGAWKTRTRNLQAK